MSVPTADFFKLLGLLIPDGGFGFSFDITIFQIAVKSLKMSGLIIPVIHVHVLIFQYCVTLYRLLVHVCDARHSTYQISNY